MAERETRKITAIRIPPSELAQIDAKASELRLTRTEYMIRCALGEPLNREATELRVDQLEERLARLEELAFQQ